tara:strand:- start:347 stop:682 length:336 start_codon:yes stop_codon:yes gene_type:complete
MYRVIKGMINKKIILGLFLLGLLCGCSSPSAMLGPAYTLTSTGNIFQTGFTYGSNELITLYTGKTPIENIKDISSKDKKNLRKQTLESEDFHILVKKQIDKTRKKIKTINQ